MIDTYQTVPSQRFAASYRIRSLTLCVFAFLLCGGAFNQYAWAQQESWADQNFPVREGLIGSFDARQMPQALEALGEPATAHGQQLSLWPDGSGAEHSLNADTSDAQPTWIEQDDYRAVRFSGSAQAFTAKFAPQSIEAATVVIVGTPFSNAGAFTGPFALSADAQNDYVSGFNLDQGPGMTLAWDTINVEGAGFGGARDLWNGSIRFGSQQRVAIDLGIGAEGVKVRVNGDVTGTRERTASTISLERWALGSRWYNNAGTPMLQGFFDGDLVAVYVWDRVLSDEEHRVLDEYLKERFGDERIVPIPQPTDGSVPLIAVENPPRLQFLEPGFTLEKLPIELTNINNLVYRHDGRLMALGYDGRLWWLDDSDGDGVEDRATLFFDGRSTFRGPIGLALTPKNSPLGSGAIVPSKGKVSLILDTNGDDIADEEKVIATGWQEITQAVDALGVDIDPRDGSIWFGLGTGDFTNAYRIDGAGEAHYDLASERGTIQRISSDLTQRETVATGIRFPVGLRFSRAGEPFVTDQEGATWLSNGNPFDELLHIQQGRHYGFPPRHPKHLPSVIDEPSTFDYGPQHQSTCGLNFNEPVFAGGRVFGPEFWRSHLFVAGYSRGKLYRTQLVSTDSGFVAQTQLIACADHLLVDAVVTPRGDLLVALHSGGPDWGSGPTGIGELWLVRSSNDAPRSIASWAESPSEIRITFDRPLDPQSLPSADEIQVEYGESMAAADRFEALRPGYQVVAQQMKHRRFALPVLGRQVTPDLRTLIVQVANLDSRTPRAITIPGLGRAPRTETSPAEQIPESDWLIETHGVQAQWTSAEGELQWQGWLPHWDMQVNRELCAESQPHQELFALLEQPGRLSLATTLDLSDLLRPVVQPGSTIDYEWPSEVAHVRWLVPQGTQLEISHGVWLASNPGQLENERVQIVATIAAEEATEISVRLQIPTGAQGDSNLESAWWTDEDERARPFPLRRFWLPWASEQESESTTDNIAQELHPLEAGGNWERGRRLFMSEELSCVKCHRYEARGGVIGPDLSNLPLRDVDSILRDITLPSFAINPDYLTQSVTTVDGGQWAGVVRTLDGKLVIGLSDGKEQVVDSTEIESITPMSQSVMPAGLREKLEAFGPTAVADLLTFLRTPGPRMPTYAPLPVPPPRTVSELDQLQAGGLSHISRERTLRILLVDGPKDHGVGEHDYPAWRESWSRWLAQAENVVVDQAHQWPTQEQWAQADTVVLFQRGEWNNERAADLDRYFARGGGLVVIHWAVEGGEGSDAFAERIGLASNGAKIRYRHGPLRLDFSPGSRHPIARNLNQVDFYDESYWLMSGDPNRLHVLATGDEDGEARPLFWTLEPQGGRVFVSILGHYMWTFDDPVFRTVMLRGIGWSAGEDVDRLTGITESGARLVP